MGKEQWKRSNFLYIAFTGLWWKKKKTCKMVFSYHRWGLSIFWDRRSRRSSINFFSESKCKQDIPNQKPKMWKQQQGSLHISQKHILLTANTTRVLALHTHRGVSNLKVNKSIDKLTVQQKLWRRHKFPTELQSEYQSWQYEEEDHGWIDPTTQASSPPANIHIKSQ